MPNLVGIGLSQVPTNSMLGGLAYQDPEHASIKDLDLKNLSQINSEIADTAGDVFVYDTRKDSDGGAWRKRTQHTSWYNETLGTATRGTRKEFPAVAVIVAGANQVTIYDGDDPDLPMWMVFKDTVSNMINTHNVNPNSFSLSALNANVLVGSRHPSYGEANVINFISDNGVSYYSAHSGDYNGSISQRNDGLVQTINSNYGTLVNSIVNDIAMTVLPNAPIDDATGLPVPTIAVGTDGGVSVIKDDGNVFDITITTGANNDGDRVDFTDDNRIVIQWGGDSAGEITIDEIPSADTSANYPINLPGSHYNDNSPGSYSPIFLTEGPSTTNRHPTAIAQFRAVGTTAALSLFDENKTSEEDGMVAYITTSYNTGYMHGDIKGAFLSDTDTTNAVGTELHPNGNSDFSSTDVSYISNSASGTATVTNGQLVVSGGTAGYSDHIINITTEVGAKYVISVDYVSNSGYNGSIGMYVNSAYLNELSDNNGYIARATGKTYTWYFTADQTTENLDLVTAGATSNTYTFDNWTIKKVEDDRSVNNNGLQVFGTVTKSAVATGAELVAYSGFSGSNYLKQPYNSSLSAGTGSQTFMGWVYANTDSTVRYLFGIGEQDSNEQFRLGFSNSVVYFDYGTGSAYSQWNSTDAIPENKWTFVVATITAGQRPRIYIDGKLLTNTPAVNNAAPSTFLTANSYIMTIGINSSLNANNTWNGSLSLIRYSHSAPSEEQIKKMYEDEKFLFQENAKVTLYGSSDAVAALAYDDSTNLLYAGTSSGRSEFQGLRRINNTTTAVTTAISASNGLVAEQ